VPAQMVYLTDGPSRQYAVDNTSLVFRHQALKDTVDIWESAVLVQGLKELGPTRIDEKVCARMREWLPATMRKKVLRDAKGSTAWVYEALKKICDGDRDV
ncbi:MAG: DUF6088 family protein, partial [Kiritimatiellia bacterium]